MEVASNADEPPASGDDSVAPAGPWTGSLAADASAAILLLLTIYITLFLVLSFWVLIEGASTDLWRSNVHEPSIVGAIGMLGGWTSNVLALMNFLFGLSGGFFASSASTSRIERSMKGFISLVCIVLMIVSLVDIVLIALGSENVQEGVFVMRANHATAKDAISALGLIHLSIVSGFLAGFAIRGVPTIGRGG